MQSGVRMLKSSKTANLGPQEVDLQTIFLSWCNYRMVEKNRFQSTNSMERWPSIRKNFVTTFERFRKIIEVNTFKKIYSIWIPSNAVS